MHWACPTRVRQAARCELCPPLFPLTRCKQGGVTVTTNSPCSHQQEATGSVGPLSRRAATPHASLGSRPAKGAFPSRSKRAYTIRYFTCRAATIRHSRPTHTCCNMHLSSPAGFLETFEAFGGAFFGEGGVLDLRLESRPWMGW